MTDADIERERLRHVHPPDWRPPAPAPRYDLVVLGGGTAGLVCAMGAAGLGARVALVERHLLGGDCLNTGCVPSKALIRSARVVGELRRAAALGVGAPEIDVDGRAVMRRLRERRVALAPHDSAERCARAGVDLFLGEGRFADARSIVVDGHRLRFGRAVIATGARPAVPPVPGLTDVPFLTNETVFELETPPRRLLMVGAGPVGCELAQAFARLGSQVTLLDQEPRLLPRDDPDAAAFVTRSLEQDGVRLDLGVRLERAELVDGSVRVLVARETPAGSTSVAGDALLVAAGRSPSVEGLGLDAAGVRVDAHGVVVDDRLRTSNSRVYAAGDVCSAYKFTHAADAMSRLVLQNALFFGRTRASRLVVPWVTYTDPEVAHVGVTHAEVSNSGGRLGTITVPLADVDRAVVDDRTDGFVRVHHESGRLRGCTIVAPHAGEMVAEAVFAITHRHSLADLSATIHPYPTGAEALRKAGDTYRRQALTDGLRRWLRRYFEWTR